MMRAVEAAKVYPKPDGEGQPSNRQRHQRYQKEMKGPRQHVSLSSLSGGQDASADHRPCARDAAQTKC
jgi:hypothetical protein